MKYKACSSCGKHSRETESSCWKCGAALGDSALTSATQFAEAEINRPVVSEAEEKTSVKVKGSTAGVDTSTVTAQIKALGDFHQWFTKKEIAHLPEVMTRGETIRALTSGYYDGNTWLITVTDQRILFLDKGMLFGLKQVDLPFHQISSISHKIGLVFGELHIATSSGKCLIKSIPKGEVAKISGILSSLVRGAHVPSAQPGAQTAPADVASQLERLAALMEKGVLTAQEFSAQKEKLLSS